MLHRPAISLAAGGDLPRLDALIAMSARQLSKGYYTGAQIEAAVRHVFGVDSILISDGTYFVAEVDGVLAGCGGWSKRAKLFGGDRYASNDAELLAPGSDPAKIRAFFVDPAFARRGVGTAILGACEVAAMAGGFTRAELMATLPGVPFYAAQGYRAEVGVRLDLDGVAVDFIPMSKQFSSSQSEHRSAAVPSP